MSTANPPQPLPVTATAPTVDERLQAIEKRLKELKPEGKDGWDKFEKLSTLMWSVVTLLVSIFVTGRIENALKERELHLENVKDMQALMQQLDKADSGTAMSCALALGAHGRYAVAPMIQVLQAGIVDHREAAVAKLLGDLNCQKAVGPLRNYVARLEQSKPDNAPFGPVPGSQALSENNIGAVKKQAQDSLTALTQQQ